MPAAPNATASTKPFSGQRILICEDNHLIAMGWASVLTKEGYAVVGPVYTGEEALQMAFQDLPDLVLLDVGLAGDIDGISVAAELAPMGVGIIFVTSDYQRVALDGREYSSDVLIKPVAVSSVLHSIASILRNKQMLGTNRAALNS
jgi:two-component system, response regulator PdtaR